MLDTCETQPTTSADNRRTVTVPEFAQLSGLHPVTVYRLIQRGELPSTRLGRRVFIPRSDAERLLCAGSAS